VKKIILLLFISIFLGDSAFATCATPDIWCRGPCPSRDHLNDNNAKPIICSANKELDDYGFGNALVGWGKNCAISAGEQSPSSTSCISTGNVMGQLIDTITTLGIGVTMRDNFCSFSPHQPQDQEEGSGGWSRDSRYLEGAILKRSFLKLCDGVSPDKHRDCMNCMFKGKGMNRSGEGCDDPPAENPDPLYLDLHIADGTKVNGGLCDGIPNLDKPLLDNGAPVYKDNKQVYCPLLRCNIPTNNIRVKYRDGVCCSILDLKNNTSRGASLSGIIRIKRVFEGDRVCAQMKFTTGYRTLACKARIPPEINMPQTACFIKGLPAFRPDGLQSKWVFPITSKVVQTMTEVLDSMFKGIPGCQGGITYFQNSMKSIVRALLILYVIFFGFKVATSKEMVGKRDLFMFILKFAMVVYFSVGSFGSTTDLSDNNGLLFVRKGVVAVMTSFSNMIIGAASPDICNFSKIQYTNGYDYLKLWDSLDCKISFYLGFASPTEHGLSSHNEGGIFRLIWGLFSGANIFILVFLFCFGLFLLSIVTYFTYLYIIAMVAITIMIFFGPIFIPMALFDQTKGYFDKWRGVLLGYALQPVVAVAVIAVMIATFDMVVYSDCKFDQRNLQGGKPYWILKRDDQSDTCRNSLGRYLVTMGESSHTSSVSAEGDKDNKSLFKYDVATNMDGIKDGLLLSTFFAFLFYFFAGQIGGLASELGGSFSFDSAAISPTGLLTAAGATVKGAASAVGARFQRQNREKQAKKEEEEYEKKEEEKRKKEEEEKKKEEEEKKKEEEEKKKREEEEKAAAEKAAAEAAAAKKAAEDAQKASGP
jgi:type IV secretory pathway VirB6-like protein